MAFYGKMFDQKVGCNPCNPPLHSPMLNHKQDSACYITGQVLPILLLTSRSPSHAKHSLTPQNAIIVGNVTSKIEKVPRGIRCGKSSKDMASSRNLVSTIGAQASPKMGGRNQVFGRVRGRLFILRGGGGWHFFEINILTLKRLKINHLSSSGEKRNNMTSTFS